MQNEKVCPGCGTQWPYVVTKAEAFEEEDADVHQQPPEPLRRKRSRGSKQVQDDGSNEPSSRRVTRSGNNEEGLSSQSQSQPSTQTSRKAKLEKLAAGEVDNAGPGPSTRRATRTSARLHR